ncbi:uncharacterized protein KY384_005386 [Bacidia gigantensis]|uniref:uncharacterized protein n=1 Tax=Bacidia gigantensis TaxID=2732470 RepID=UPI001D040351|nr:uncharacterized protein KY384_005386 [Bacidia gigantensis]KAG8529905.1 hypothetical protein KY384_005386 [Bacidia gigantensis]
MDVTPPAVGTMGPPMHSSPETDLHAHMSNGVPVEGHQNQSGGLAAGLSAAAATSAQQPKVVQTAFIHKLYSMLEDSGIQNLISWSTNNESFVMSPTADFAKVLSQYFKHTNISSFVRQLNMYGFHKVSDVFHTGSPDATLWEFKHGNGSFRKGDLAGLREIKRRASRHAIIHRDSYSAPNHHKASISHPGTPTEALMDPTEARLSHLDQLIYDIQARLIRSEENNIALSAKCHTLNDSLVRSHQWSLDLTHMVSSVVTDPDHPVRRDAATMERDIARQLDLIRNYEDPHESLLSGRQPYFSNMALQEPVSPRAAPVDERRSSLHAIPPRSSTLRPQPPPANASMPQRRYGSIGTANPLPNYHRPFQPQTQIPPALPQHPLANVSEPGPNLGRRHTSADIRVPGWPGHAQSSPNASGQSSGHWPSSPTQQAHNPDQNVHDQLASYEFGRPRQSISSYHDTPPLTSNETTPSTLSVESNWSWNTGSKFAPRIMDSAPNTRRSSMASNVHSLLNPAETAEREDEDPLYDERKRKRIV